jgi:hypothetical protein
MFKQEVYGGLASTRAVDTNILDKDIVVLVGKNPASNFKESKKINQFLPIYMQNTVVTQQLNEVIIKWECWNINNDLYCCYYIVTEYFYDDNIYTTTVNTCRCDNNVNVTLRVSRLKTG